jgi:hypothetical protein
MTDGFDFASMDLPPAARTRRRGPDGLTRALAVALGLALAFSVGVRAGRASRPSAPPVAPGPASPATTVPPPPGAAVTGRVDIVDRDVLYVTGRDGHRVKVVVGDGARLSAVTVASLADMHVGDTVTVEGERAPDGTVMATDIANHGLQ